MSCRSLSRDAFFAHLTRKRTDYQYICPGNDLSAPVSKQVRTPLPEMFDRVTITARPVYVRWNRTGLGLFRLLFGSCAAECAG